MERKSKTKSLSHTHTHTQKKSFSEKKIKNQKRNHTHTWERERERERERLLGGEHNFPNMMHWPFSKCGDFLKEDSNFQISAQYLFPFFEGF